MAFSAPSRPAPGAGPAIPAAIQWLQSEQQDAEARLSQLRASADWLDGQASESAQASEALLLVEREIGMIASRQMAARDAIAALAFFQN